MDPLLKSDSIKDGNLIDEIRDIKESISILERYPNDPDVPDRLVYNVKEYGAIGDGSTDDSAAIQRAVDSVTSEGWIIFVPTGTYLLGSEIAVSNPVNFIGQGRASSIFKRTTNGYHLVFSNTDHVSVQDIGFDGNYPTLTTGSGLSFVAVDDVEVINCRFTDMHQVAISFAGECNRIIIEGNYIDNCGLSGIRFGGSPDRYVWIRNNYIKDPNGEATGGHSGIQIQGSGTHQYFWIEKNYIENSGTVGIGADLLEFGWIRDNYIYGNGSTGECIALAGSYVEISGNKVTNAGSAGILFFATDAHYSHINIKGNFCWANITNGIALVWGVDNVTMQYINVEGNISLANARGIQSYKNSGGFTSAWQDITIWFNQLYGNITEAINLINGADVTLFANKSNADDVDINSIAYADYAGSSTINGFSSETKYIYTKAIGSTIKVKFRITGNADGTTVNFTLPYASKSVVPIFEIIVITDAGSRAYGHMGIANASATVNCFPDAAESAWTASSTREVAGQFEYEAVINP